MKKKIFTMLIVLLAIVGKGMAADLPITPSTDTGNGAVWYYIKWNCGGDGIKCFVPNGLNEPLGIHWGDPDPFDDRLLYCFVGDEANGFEIYNKAYLAGKTVDGVTFTEDLKLQNLGKIGEETWTFAGYSTSVPEGELITKWIIGDTWDDSANGERIILAPDREYGWWKSGSSQCELGPVSTWEGAYAASFEWVSGGTPPPLPEVTLPFTPSENTGDGAIWYYMFWDTQWGSRPMYANRLDNGISIEWGNPKYDEDQFLFCFIGNTEDGFEVYNKAFLNGKTVATDDDGGTVTLTEDLKIQNYGGEWNQIGYSLNPPADGNERVTRWYVHVGQDGQLVEGKVVAGKTALTASRDGNEAWWVGSNSILQWGGNTTWNGTFSLHFTQAVPLEDYSYELSPADGATAVAVDAPVTISFNNNIVLGEYMVEEKNLISVKADNQEVDAIPSVKDNVFTLAFAQALLPGTTYTITIEPGAIIPLVTGDENKITWTFTTDGVRGIGDAVIAEESVISVSGKEVTILASLPEPVEVYTATGALALKTTGTQFTLESGFYIIKAGTELKKVIIK
ncbi:MAG: Ig-like domain-containing protein [Candidatus Azobacteroides sp.]|nr:Ig-like domain-containing protein [Candidatus Azobacteroides sp.]